MADDNKRVENVCAKVTERMMVDIGRVCAVEDLKPSEYVYRLIRNDLYGRSMRANEIAERITSVTDRD